MLKRHHIFVMNSTLLVETKAKLPVTATSNLRDQDTTYLMTAAPGPLYAPC